MIHWQLMSEIMWAISLDGLVQSLLHAPHADTSLITRSLNIECDIFSPQLSDCHIYLWEQTFEMPVHGDSSPRFYSMCAHPFNVAPRLLMSLLGFGPQGDDGASSLTTTCGNNHSIFFSPSQNFRKLRCVTWPRRVVNERRVSSVWASSREFKGFWFIGKIKMPLLSQHDHVKQTGHTEARLFYRV